MPSLFLLLSLFVWSGLSARTSVLETPKTFVPKKKPPKTIQVEILQPGTDCTIRATRGDRAEIQYKLLLFSSEKVVDYHEPNEAYVFRIGYGESIAGLDQGIIGMCVNETRKMIIPSYLAYGTRGATVIVPPGASIILEVTLLDLFPMEFDEKRYERVQQTKLVFDKRQKDAHYMHENDRWTYPTYHRQKPRDEEEAEERAQEERKRHEEEEKQAELEREKAEDEEMLQKEIARLKAEGKLKEETPDVVTRTYQRVRKNRKAQIQKHDPVEQLREEIQRRRQAERDEKAQKAQDKEDTFTKTPTGRHFRGLPRPSRLRPLMNPGSHRDENREKEKDAYKEKTRQLEDKRRIGRERKEKIMAKYYPLQKTEEQVEAEKAESEHRAAEAEKQKKISNLKESLLNKKGDSNSTDDEDFDLDEEQPSKRTTTKDNQEL